MYVDVAMVGYVSRQKRHSCIGTTVKLIYLIIRDREIFSIYPKSNKADSYCFVLLLLGPKNLSDKTDYSIYPCSVYIKYLPYSSSFSMSTVSIHDLYYSDMPGNNRGGGRKAVARVRPEDTPPSLVALRRRHKQISKVRNRQFNLSNVPFTWLSVHENGRNIDHERNGPS